MPATLLLNRHIQAERSRLLLPCQNEPSQIILARLPAGPALVN